MNKPLFGKESLFGDKRAFCDAIARKLKASLLDSEKYLSSLSRNDILLLAEEHETTLSDLAPLDESVPFHERLQLQFDALEAVCGPPPQYTQREAEFIQRARNKFQAQLSKMNG